MVRTEGAGVQRMRQREGNFSVACGDGDSCRQTARDIGGETRTRQNCRQRTWRALGDDLGHEFVRAALDAFRAGNQWSAFRQRWCQRCDHRSHGLRRDHDENRLAAGCLIKVTRHLDGIVQLYTGEEPALALLCEARGIVRIVLPKHDVSPRTRASEGQCRSPGATTEHRDALNGHALLPPAYLYAAVRRSAPSAAAISSSGQRARGAVSRGSLMPSASRSQPAQAIIAPLSVQSSGGGATKFAPTSKARRLRTFRIA